MSVVTIASALRSAEIPLNESVYADFSDTQIHFPMYLPGEIGICSDEDELLNYVGWRIFYDLLAQKRQSPKYQEILSEIEVIDSENRRLNTLMNEVQSQGQCRLLKA